MGFSNSKAEYSAEYSISPSVVAGACQTVIKAIGLDIKKISRETGMISAKSSMLSFGNAGKTLILQISKTEDGASVRATATAAEGLLTTGGAQKLITEFFSKLGAHPDLINGSKGGW